MPTGIISHQQPSRISLRASKFVQPLYLTSLLLVAVSITSATYYNIKKDKEIASLQRQLKDKDLSAAYLLFETYRTQDTVVNGRFIMSGVGGQYDTIPIQGNLFLPLEIGSDSGVTQKSKTLCYAQQGVWQNTGLTEAVFQLLFFNLAAYPAGRYKFRQVQIINIKL